MTHPMPRLIIAILVVLALIAILCVGYYRKATYEVKNPVATLEIKVEC